MSSEEPLRLSISSQAGLHPDEIARRTFPTARRGVDPEAVRRFLESVAVEVRELHEREQVLRRHLQDAERRAAEPELDEQTLLRSVGVETARILQTAHESAADVVGKAEARAAELVQTVGDEAAAAAASIRQAATSEAEALTERARSEAVALLEATRSECRRIVREAQELRASVLGDLSSRRRALRVQLEQLRTGRDSLLNVVDAVGEAVDQLRDRLSNAEHEARLAAAEAGDRVAAEDDEDLLLDVEAQLEVQIDLEEAGLLEAQPAAGAPEEVAGFEDGDAGSDDEVVPSAGDAAPSAGDAVPSAGDAAPATPEGDGSPGVGDEPDTVVTLVFEAESSAPDIEGSSSSQMAGEPGPSAALYDVEADVAEPDVANDASGSVAAEDDTGEPVATSHRSVDELFAKIRAGRSDGASRGAAPEPGPEAEAEPEPAAEAEAEAAPEAEAEPDVPETADTEVAQEVEAEPGAADETSTGESSPEAAALARRGELTEPVTAKLKRALKRTMQDDQNILLDALRHASGPPDLDAALPEKAQCQRLEKATVAVLADAWTVGYGWLGGADAAKSAALEAGRGLAADLATEVTRLLRHRLREALATMGEAGDGGADAASAAYREWRSGRIDSVAGDFVTRAFASGAVAGGKGTPVSWVVDDEGQPCPDCDDNALAGELRAGEEFPTGQVHPPVHPGCRCLLVPTNS